MTARSILILALILVSGCGRACEVSVPSDPVELFVGAESFQSIQQTLSEFSEFGQFREIEGDIKNVKCIDQPVNRVVFQHAMNESKGRMELVFYFGRLAEMRFHPDDSAIFFSEAKKHGLPSKLGQETTQGNKVLWVNGSDYTAETLGVSDQRLVKKFMQWVRQRD